MTRVHKQTEETRRKISESLKQAYADGTRSSQDMSDTMRGQIRKTEVKYRAWHGRVKVKHGRPSHCEFCGVTSGTKFEWAHRHDAPWSSERGDWLRLCVKCHRIYDKTGTRGWVTRRANQAKAKEMQT